MILTWLNAGAEPGRNAPAVASRSRSDMPRGRDSAVAGSGLVLGPACSRPTAFAKGPPPSCQGAAGSVCKRGLSFSQAETLAVLVLLAFTALAQVDHLNQVCPPTITLKLCRLVLQGSLAKTR